LHHKEKKDWGGKKGGRGEVRGLAPPGRGKDLATGTRKFNRGGGKGKKQTSHKGERKEKKSPTHRKKGESTTTKHGEIDNVSPRGSVWEGGKEKRL